ncbi:MAG: RagB/SusD family nutrient uptake outer membrane protein [Paludibacteraceae bacterium]|nr:RagB/SusD family nutrient uptake outer membrane protein [Paludibacteraceae bacterium]MBR6685782.1 RagB/SusD family nutrient uptake outer membrane protein [Paludibacteraceae bacterium]
MKINLKKLGLLLGVGMMFSLQSCTDFLEPEIYSEYDRNDFESSESAFDAKLGDVYVNLQREYGYVYREGHWSLQENTTDECIVPTRYLGDWLDGNAFWILHNHRYTSKSREISANGQSGANAWGFAYRGISQCNSMMKWMRSIDLDKTRPADMAELYILRAWYHYLLMDNFGNIPYTSSLAENGYEAVQNTRAEVFDSIMTDLTKYVPQASEQKIYSRVNKYVGWMVLSKMYLNAEAWGVAGKAKFAPSAQECYEKAALYADSVITKGGYILEPDYFTNFKVDNQGSKENIWCVFYDASFSKGMQFHMMSLHYASQNSYGLKNQPWNGYCTTHKVIGLYGEGDKRIDSWERGQQYDKSGAALSVEVSVDSATYVLMPEYVRKPKDWPSSIEVFRTKVRYDEEGKVIGGGKLDSTLKFNFPAYFTDTVTTLTNNGKFKVYNIFEGPRFVKFQIQEGVGDHMSNDFPIFRLADAYLMKAEALMRANGDVATQEAVDAANEVRSRAGAKAYSIADLTLDELCNERCRELMWEGHRRQDLIRFGRYTGPNSVQNDADPANLWILKYAAGGTGYDIDPESQVPFETPDYMKVFPLPDFYVDNGNKQNDGYSE